MNFNMNEVLADMLAAMKGVVANNWNEVKSVAGQLLQRRKERLELLTGLRLKGEISQEKFELRLADEKLVLEAELNAVAVVSKAVAQKAVNAAAEVLEKAVKAAISTLI